MAFSLSRGRAAAVAVLAAAGIAVATWVAAEDSDGRTVAGAIAEVVGTGGDVSAAGATVNVSGSAKSVSAAGATVSIKATVSGDVWAAAADFTFEGSAGSDIRVLAARVTLRGRAGESVWAAGAAVDADIATGGNMKVGAGHLVLGPATDIAGSLNAGGGDIAVAGHVAGEVNLAGGRVLFDGRADKTVSIEADALIVGPNAVIAGDLVLIGDTTASVDPAARITGQTRQKDSRTWFFGPRVDPRPGQFGFALFLAGTAILTGIGLMLLGRASFDEAASLARQKPVSRFLIGLVVVILIPIVAAGLAITVIGIPLGIGLLLFLPFLFIIGHATMALGIADWVFNRGATPRGVGRSILLLIVGAIGIAILGIIPVVGPLIVCVTLLLGAGAFLSTLHGRLRRAFGV